MKNLINNKKFRNTLIVLTLIILLMLIVLIYIFSKKDKIAYNGEIARSMAYEQVKDGDEDIEGTDYVKFDAFFLRDLDGDGYAESIRGSSRKIGESDTLYMELNVLTNGYLEDAVIEINNDNFYFQTAIPKDNEVKENAIGNNIKQIKLNTINNGTQRLLTGMVRSGDYNYTNTKASAIGNDINKYSNNMYSANRNSITLTGTHVEIVKDSDGNDVEKRTPIEKTVYFDIDWHGTTRTQIPNYLAGERNLNQIDILDNVINEENNTITFTYNIGIQEIDNMLILSKAHIETEIPDFEGYVPTKVEVIGTNTTYNYNEETRKLVAERQAEINEDGTIKSQAYDGTYSGARYNKFKVEITYPLEAYEKLGSSGIERQLLVSAYYEGFNNQSEEFTNPYKSNTIKANFTLNIDNTFGSVAKLDIFLGKYVYTPTRRYIVSKDKVLNIYNEIASTEDEDLYEVRWKTATGEDGNGTGWVIKEDKAEGNQRSDEFLKLDGTSVSMENITTNLGIYFSNPSAMLGDDGWIKVYDDETDELIETFTKDNWSKYSSSNPYTYKEYIKHIRIETSETYKNAIMYIYNIKKLDDEYIVNTFSKEEFDNLTQIRTIANAYFNGSYFETCTSRADYEAPYSKADITLSSSSISTQETYKNMKITINANANQNVNQIEWLNSAFLLKLPKDLLDIEINSVLSNNDNVKIVSYEQYIENGEKFIKINTENSEPTIFEINIDCNITPDPRMATKTDNITLYSYNENAVEYWKYEKEKDIYDINDNLNKDEIIGKTSKSINLVSPSSILTNEVVSNYDDIGSITVSPQIAIISKEQRTANINLEIKNNYTSTISEVCILGRVPYENNNYTINGNPMESEFTATMQSTMILPEELREKAIVYYSENGEATRDLADSANGWTTNPTDFSKIKSYMIDLCDYVLAREETKQFTYTVSIPENLNYNQVSYSHHGVYFTLDTAEGKYKTKTEPNKVGLMIGKKYNLELTKYQIGKDKLIPGATYSIIEEGQEEGKTRVTGIDGKLIITDLLIEKTYIVKEIKSPAEYELNSSEIKFTTTEENGQLKVTLIDGNVKKIQTVQPDTENGYRVQLEVEDEVKAGLKIIKIEEGSSTPIGRVLFKITGEGLPKAGRTLTTNVDGEADLKGLLIGTEYTLEEIRAEGYYLGNPIKFVISNTLGVYSVSIIEGNVKNKTITEVDSIPTASLTIENNKIPRYNLQINKIVKGETTSLAGAKFRLFKGTEKIDDFVTNENGIITINNLYQYESNKNIDQTYTLKEIEAPEGYAVVKDITFKVENIEGLLTMDVLEGNIKEQTANGNTISIIIEDSPSFKLIKKDGETGEVLPGTKFVIYNVDNGTEQLALDSKFNILGTKETINGKDYYTLTTNENGEITADLREGLYKAIEVQTSNDRYELTDNEYYFGIGASREVKTGMGVTWATSVGENYAAYENFKEISSIATTDDGGVIAGGHFYDTIEVGDYILTSDGDGDGILIKYDTNGKVEWAKSIGGNGNAYIESLASTSDGGFIVGVEFYGPTKVGEYTFTTSSVNGPNGMYYKESMLLIKYNQSGEVEWAKETKFTGNYFCVYSITETIDRDIVVVGEFQGTFQVGDDTITASEEAYIIKYDATGEVEWAKSFNVPHDYSALESVTATSDGSIIVSGWIGSEYQLGDYKLNPGTPIVKYSSSGEIEWATVFEDSGESGWSTYINSVTATSDGGWIAGGYFYDTIEVGEYTLTSNGDSDGILIKYSQTGEVEWATSFGGAYEGRYRAHCDEITSVISTSDGGYIVGGKFGTNDKSTVNIQVGEYTLTSNGGTDGILIKYSQTGEVEWAKSVGGSDDGYINSVAITSDGSIIAGGYFEGTIQIEGYLLTSKSYFDEMIFKLEETELANPVTVSAKSIGGTEDDNINSITATSDGGYIAGGTFKGTIKVGEYTLTSNGDEDGMLIKYNSSGEVEWAKAIGGSSSDNIISVSEISDGGILAGGYFSGTIQVGEYTLTSNGSSDGMLIKYNANGEVEWAKSIGGNNSDEISSVAGTTDGGYIAGGTFKGTIQVGEYTLTSNGGSDEMLIKYDVNGEVEWATSIGGTGYVSIESITETSDRGIVVVGWCSGTIQVGDYILNGENVVIKYNLSGEVEWATSIDSTNYSVIYSVAETSDGGIIVVGEFEGTFDTQDYKVTTESNVGGMIIKYDCYGKVEWAKALSGGKWDVIANNFVIATKDGGFIAGGDFTGTIQVGEYTLTSNGSSDGMLIKYDVNGKVEWAKSVGGSSSDWINAITELKDGTVIAGGNFSSSTIETDGKILTNNGRRDGMLLKIVNYSGVPEVQEITVENNIKEFKITTSVNEIDGIKGGSISGEDIKPYEIIKYGDNSTKEIIMIPDEGYEIIGITVNGEDYQFVANKDGTYTMPLFENLQEDKHIEVTYSLKDNKIIINKVDSNTKESLTGVKFKLDQLEERVEPENVIGTLTANGKIYTTIDTENEEPIEGTLTANGKIYTTIDTENEEPVEGTLTANGQEYTIIDTETEEPMEETLSANGPEYGVTINKEKEITGAIGELTNNGTYYFAKQNGSYIPTNGRTYQRANGGKKGIPSVTANSYVPIDLTNKQGKYFVVVNAETSSQSTADYGYATITETTTAPAYNSAEGRFIYESGTVSANDYTSAVLEGGKIYYLHLGYRKDANGDTDSDQIKINSINVYGSNIISYNFEEIDGKYIPNNLNKVNTIANSYIPIDLTNKEGKYAIRVNAETNYTGGSGYLYATITEDTIAPVYNSSTGRFMYISGTKVANDYTSAVLEGGKIYYLHIGYQNGTGIPTKVSINSISMHKVKQETYNFEEIDGKYIPNNLNKINTIANSYIPIDLTNKEGKYAIKVNAETNYTGGSGYLYATIREDTTVPAYNLSTGRFMYIYATKVASDYTSAVLEGGKIYYLHIGYKNNTGTPTKVSINSISMHKAEQETYCFVEQNGTLIPTNSKTYQIANGGTAGKGDRTANSYIPIDLTGKEGNYAVVINAQVSSEYADYGYATITETTTAPAYTSSTGRFIYISGTYSTVAKDYTSTILEGGKKYYLHLGYYKSANTDSGDDQIVFNSIKLYKATQETYNFVENEGKYESNNQNKNNTTANSYIPIDLTGYSGKYNLTVNAEISSEVNRDYGYATVTEDTTAPSKDSWSTGSNIKRFIYISGTQEAKDYTKVLQGGKKYYLHLGYYKNADTDVGDDKFTINSVNVSLNDSELYHTEVETNSVGQAITQIPFGKYNLTEIVTPEGYEVQKGSAEIEFNADGTRSVIKSGEETIDENGNVILSPIVTVNEKGEFVVENIAKAKVIVRHYLKDRNGNITEIEVAEGEELEGKSGENYTTTPHLDLDKYELEKDEAGEYVIPENATGEYTGEVQEVIYYYVEKQIPLTVHHYIEGTTTKVPLIDGTEAEDEYDSGYENDEYTTNAISNDRLSNEYELVETPVNSEGTYTGNEIEVTYFYKKIERKVIIQKYAEDGTTPLSGATFTIRKTNEIVEDSELIEYTTNQNGKIEVTLEAGEYDITETKAPEGYKLPENPTTKITIDRDTTEVVANIVNERIQGTVTVHHYIKGTTTPVLLLDGTEAEDEIKTGNVGSTYITTPRLDIQDGYVYVDSSNNTRGTYIDGNIDIIYYYGIRTDLKYVVNYLEKDTNNVLQEPSIFENQTFGNTIISNEKVISIDGYVYDSLSPETLTISSDNNQNIINIYYVKNEIDLKVTKIWNDSNNKRPEQIKVIVKSNGNQVAETILTADNAKDNSSIWEYTFEKLIKYDNDGKLIDYTLEEQEVNTDDLKFYTVEIGNIIPEIDESGKTTSYTAMITNTFTVSNDTIDIKVNKVWDDNNNINGKRPNSIKLIVSKVKNEEDISEVNQSAMTIDSKVNIKNDTEENNSNTLTRAENIVKETNTTVEEKEDSNLSQNTNDKDLVNSEGLNESNTENSIVDEIVKDEITEESVDGDTIDETKVESKIEEVEKSNEIADKNVEDNNSVMEASEVKEFTNEAEENTSNANLSNDISDEDLLDSLDLITPEKTTIVSTHVLEVSEEEFANNTWEYTFTKLPKYDENGNEIKYVVTEETMLFYEATGGEVVIGTDSEGSTTYTATLTNIFKVPTDTVNITVNKVWVDNVEQMNRRPESIVIKLMNGDKELNQEVITAENNWTSTFAGFAKYDDLGNEINYTVSEESVEFYTPSYSPVTKDGENYSITITNTFTGSNETTQIPVEKVWNDNNKERLSSIILVLTGNGQEYTQTLTENNMSSINTWKYIFTDLPKYDDNGIEIVYTLSEKGVNTGDLDKYIQTVEGYTVTNTLIIKDSEITKTGPTTITSLQETMNYTINYKASIDENYTNDATVTIIDTLPYEIDTEKPYNLNGGIYDSKNKTITWTEVMKKPVDITKNISLVYKDVELSDTTATITNNVKGSIELANGVKEEKETSFDTTTNFTKKIILNKVWVGDGEISRPDSITVNLKGLIKGTNEAGEETTIEYTLPEEISKATIKASDNWTYTWNNLPKYDQVTSQEITYSVEEAQIPGYYNSLTEENNIFTLTNYKYGNVLITKVDSKNKAEKLGGAEFKLEKLIEQNGEMVVDTSFIAITQTTSTSEETKGQANFVNLEYGKYRLIETKAPEGYNLLSNPIDIEISNDNTDISLEISNIATTVLPATGGRGINVLTLIGILVIFLAIKLKTTTVKTKKLK